MIIICLEIKARLDTVADAVKTIFAEANAEEVNIAYC